MSTASERSFTWKRKQIWTTLSQGQKRRPTQIERIEMFVTDSLSNFEVLVPILVEPVSDKVRAQCPNFRRCSEFRT
jgi:hypothetical protein